MKRSDAITIILKELIENKPATLRDMRKADIILTKLEEVGMVPPVAYPNDKNGFIFRTNKWEPEE